MSAYRDPVSPPLLSQRFERVLPGLFTRVRISDARVRVDAPDVMAMVMSLQFMALLFPLLAHWSWMLALAVSLALCFTTRIHLRVTRGKVWLVRSLLGVPYWVQRPSPSPDCIQVDWDFEGEDLVVVVAPWRSDEFQTVPVLGSSWHGVRWAELDQIQKACARLLA